MTYLENYNDMIRELDRLVYKLNQKIIVDEQILLRDKLSDDSELDEYLRVEALMKISTCREHILLIKAILNKYEIIGD